MTAAAANVKITPKKKKKKEKGKKKTSGTNLHSLERVTPDFFLTRFLHCSRLGGTLLSGRLDNMLSFGADSSVPEAFQRS